MATDLTARLDDETKKAQSFQFAPIQQSVSPAVPTLGTGLHGMSRVISESGVTAPNPDTGFITGPSPGAMPKPIAGAGRDESGVITAESAPRAMGNDMQRSGGVYGGIDMAGANAVMARENKARGEMIDLSIKANGGNGIAVMSDSQGRADAEWNAGVDARSAVSDMKNALRQAGTRTERAALGQALSTMMNNQVQQRGQDMNFAAQVAQQGITARGQDLNAISDANRNAVTMRGQDIGANTDAVRLGIDQQRLGIQQQDANRAGDKWAIEKGVVQGQAQDAQSIRDARAELTDAINSGDQAKLDAANAKAVAVGIKLDKPNNEFTAVTDANGVNITRTNKDTGAVDIIDGRTGALKASIAAPGGKQAVSQAPATAIDFLKKNPGQAAAFKSKYGYLPEGY